MDDSIASRRGARRRADHPVERRMRPGDRDGARSRRLLDEMHALVGLLAASGAVLELNRAALRLTGLRREEIAGRPLWGLPPWSAEPGTRALLRAAVATANSAGRARLELELPPGSALAGTVLLLHLALVRTRSGEAPILLLEGHEVTELRRLAQRLSEDDGRRRVFVSDASHELKTPLAITTVLVERALGHDALPADVVRDLEAIREQAAALSAQVADLLHATSVDEGAVEPVLGDHDLAAVARQVARGFQALAASREVRLELETPEALVVRVDAARAATMMSNLLSNAIKASPPGGVVRMRLWRARIMTRIEVSDEGPGIADELREAIFERFKRGGPDPEPPGGGSGIGLALVRRIAALHLGRVRVHTAPGGGACFLVELPLLPAGGEPVAARHGVGEAVTSAATRLRADLPPAGAQTEQPRGGR